MTCMHGSGGRKVGFLICTVIFTLMSGDHTFAQSSANDDIHISAIVEFYYLRVYQKAKKHKAFAVGPGGYSGWSIDYPTHRAAEKTALATCLKMIRSSPYRSVSSGNCVLFDVDGKRTGLAEPIGVPLGTIPEEPDLPLIKGHVWEPIGRQSRGNMLLVHGCNRPHVDGWRIAWVNFYRASGFRVFLPDSFAESRDAELCGEPGETGVEPQTRILKLRIAQTRRTLANLRKRFPKDPIYLHGHSEGGLVVQVLGEEDISGIIVTGASCGLNHAKIYWTARNVPILVVAGTKDKAIINGSNPKRFSAYCRTVQGPGRMTVVSVPGLGHYAAIWRPEVSEAVAKFLKVPEIRIARRPSDGVSYPLSGKDAAKYDKTKRPKALAADWKGNWAWDSLETHLDSEESALFYCDQIRGHNAFADPRHQHACVVVDVNGKRLVK